MDQNQLPTWGTSKTLADYFKESATWQGSSMANTATIHNNTTTTSMPWAAAVKSPPDHAANSFDYNNTIGSWSSPETSSSNRGGWNTDGSNKNDGVFDDGTAIWGNPTTKKTGVDWTDKESLMNPPQAIKSSSLDKRTQKAEPNIGSINGTEAWGAPVRSSINNIINNNNVNMNNNGISITSNSSSSIQQQSKNDNSGNTYGTKSVDGTLGWGAAAAAAAASSSSSSLQATNENSSPPNHSVWNNLAINKQKSSDWLASSNSSAIGCNPTAISRFDELNKQLESTSLFDSVSTMTKASSSSNNHNLDMSHHPIGVSLGVGSNIANSIGGGNFINDLKQISANYSNDLLESLNRQPNLGGGPSGNSNNNNNHNQQQSQQLESAYSSTATPSRDLLKQMVHQIQLAVQAGHLNAHILNQPMSTPTLQLVYQLLQQIKTLHQLQEIQQRANIKSDPSSPSNMDIQINRIRQNISLLQKAITQQQAALTKNEAIVDSNINKQQHQQQQANSHSYATISKLSTNFTQPVAQAAVAPAASASYSSSAIGGLSLQSNPWMFASSASSLSMRGVVGGNNMAVGNNKNHGVNEGNSLNNKLDDDNAAHKMIGGDPLFMKTSNANNSVGSDSLFMKTNNAGNIQRSSSALYGWSDLASSLNESNQLKQQQQQQQHVAPSVSSNIIGSARPAPPPGLMSNFGSLIGTSASSVNGISLLDSPKLAKNSHDEAQVSNREPLSSLWSGTWFD